MRSLSSLLVLGFGACSAPSQAPALTAINPDAVSALGSTSAVLHGERLFASARVPLDHRAPAELDVRWLVRIDDIAIDASWSSPEAIDVMIPSGLPVGFHDVIATSPAGTEIVLPNGLEVTEQPSGDASPEPDASPMPDGSHMPLALALTIPNAMGPATTFTVTAVVTNSGSGATLGVP